MALTSKQREALQEAIECLDEQWDRDADRGLRDTRGGMEYRRMSPTETLRALLEEFSS